MDELLIRCSSLSKIMGQCKDAITPNQLATLEKLNLKGDDLTSKQKTERTRLQKKLDNKPKFDLSEGAKTYIRKLVKMEVYDYTLHVENKQLTKGTICEDDSINLHNEVFFTKYKKNEIRLYNEFIQGECDVDTGEKIQDYKTSWSKDTFPELPSDIVIGGYEWQGRGYMMLYDRPLFELVYCLVDTPDELLDFENNLSIHHVDDIEPELRITKLSFERDLEKEELIKYKVKECRKYYSWRKEQIALKYG
jgi:hypothetical protein